jgi:hypothetical protein
VIGTHREAGQGMAFGHDTTTNEILETIDLSGKSALVTGASGGLGAETARSDDSRIHRK